MTRTTLMASENISMMEFNLLMSCTDTTPQTMTAALAAAISSSEGMLTTMRYNTFCRHVNHAKIDVNDRLTFANNFLYVRIGVETMPFFSRLGPCCL